MKQYKSFYLSICIILASSMSLLAQDIQDVQPQEFVIHEDTQTITINNKNFELFLSGIVQEAVQAGKQARLSEALLHCYECMMEEQKECYIKDLHEAMPELLMIASEYCHDKAHNGIAGPGGDEIAGPGSCDLSAVISLLHQIFTALNKCCAILQRDFRETWTILAEITGELQGTFTVLADLKATISSDFNQTWTILADIKSTITECCANITREFQETWTILAAITNEINGTFTVLADLKATISSDFNQTWTILDDIKSTITECCANITREFQETWTILDAGFNGTFSVLVDINATISSDFNQTWTILNDIKNTITECCADITREFQETWTILNAGFNGTFSVLVDINATISSDFNQTWTILNDIKNTITECCANITIEFQETWTIINAGFNGTFTAIEEINLDAAGTFSVLADINNTLTICCENITREFQETWTILASLSVTATVDLSTVFTVIEDIRSTVTECCENITREFQETWTILNALSSPCSATPITAPTIISAPGYYCLANDIVGTLTITASNVSVDLNNHTISAPGTIGVFLNGAQNAIVFNGKINNVRNGVEFTLTNSTQVSDLLITNCSNNGIQFNTAPGSLFGNIIEDVTINAAITGINVQQVNNSFFNRITINRTFFGIFFTGSSSNTIQYCQVVDCGRSTGATAINTTNGSDNKFFNCSVMNFNGQVGFSIGSSNTILENCIVQNISFFDAVFAIRIISPNCVLKNCAVIDVLADSIANGFSLQSSDVTLENCLVDTCVGQSSLATVAYELFAIQRAQLLNCQALGSLGFGFRLNAANTIATFKNCEAAYNGSDGFFIGSLTVSIGDCISFNNTGAGFNVTVVGTAPLYGCFASQNTGGNYINAPNVTAAATARRFTNSFI